MSPHLLSGAARMAGSSLLRLQVDDRLVALVRDGHDPAFSALVDRYRPELLRYATRLVGDGRAEDVVQQALLNAHTSLVSSDADIQLRPWLYRIVHNAALNVLRSSRAQVELDERLAAPGAGIEQDLETRERLRDALAAIARLPEPQRDALTLRAIEGRTHQEIAAALAVSPSAARQHVHRARTTVRAAVSAITPYGLMARFAMAGDDPAGGALASSAGAGASAGLAATVTKVGAGVLAAGAIATGTVGHVPFVPRHHAERAAAQQRAEDRAGVAAPAAAAPAALEAAAAAAPAAAVHGRSRQASRSHDRGRHSSGGGSSGHGSSSSSSGHGSSGEDRPSSGSSRGSSHDDGGGEDHRGSATTRPSTSGDDGSHDSHSGSGSGSDDGGSSGLERTSSGTSGGSGDDAVLATTGTSDSGSSGGGDAVTTVSSDDGSHDGGDD